MSRDPHEVGEPDGEPDPVFVAQVRQALRSYLAPTAGQPLGEHCRRQLQGWTASVLAASEELVAITVPANLATDPGAVLAGVDLVTGLLAELDHRTAQLRAALTGGSPDAPGRD